MPASVGLVLGAGGIVGASFHAGALAGLAEATGWDPRRAAIVVGTSAGSGIGAALRGGMSAADQFARAQDLPLSPEGAALTAHMTDSGSFPFRPDAQAGFGRLRPPQAPHLMVRTLARPFRGRGRPLGPALAGMLPEGVIDTAIIGDRIRSFYGARRWPADPLWICAVRLRDGARVVFGRDHGVEPDVGTAAEASSAIPGFFRPVRIDGERYVDGGIHSPTNADLLVDTALDAVVVVSPMSATPSAFRQPTLAMGGRMWSGRNLASEVRALRRAGVPVLVIQPTSADIAVMGPNAMDATRRGAVARQANESSQARLARDDAHEVVAVLTRAADD